MNRRHEYSAADARDDQRVREDRESRQERLRERRRYMDDVYDMDDVAFEAAHRARRARSK